LNRESTLRRPSLVGIADGSRWSMVHIPTGALPPTGRRRPGTRRSGRRRRLCWRSSRAIR